MKKYIVLSSLLLSLFSVIGIASAAQVYRITCDSTPTFSAFNVGFSQQPRLPAEASAAARTICSQNSGKTLKVTQRCIGDSKTRLYYEDINATDDQSAVPRQIDHDWAACKERYEYVKCEAKDSAYWFGRGSMFTVPFHILLPAFLEKPKITASMDPIIPFETPNIWCAYSSTKNEAEVNVRFKLQGPGIVATDIIKKCTVKQSATNPRTIISSEYLKTAEGIALERDHYSKEDKNRVKMALIACAPNLPTIDIAALTENCEAKPTAQEIQECRDRKSALSESINGSSRNIALGSKYAMLCGAPTRAAICASAEQKQELKTQCGMSDESLQAFCNQRPTPPSTPGAECTASGGSVKTDDATNRQFCDCNGTGKPLVQTTDGIGKCGNTTTPPPSQCGSDARPQDTETGTSVCICNDSSKVYESSSKTCVAPSEAACHARGNNYIFAAPNSCTQCPTGLRMNGNQCGCFEGYRPEAGRCVPSSPTGPATWCNGPSGAAGQHQIKRGEQCFNCPANQNPNEAKTECVPQQQGPQPKAGDECVFQGQKGVIASDGRTCEVRRCLSGCQNGQCVDGRCVPCQQGQVFQNGQCVNDPRQQQQNEEQRCRQNGGEMVQGQCIQKKPNPQQQQQQQKQPQQQPQQQGMTPQQQQQMQQMQAMQECQMRQPQGAWQWNGFQCLPNPNYKPQGYGEQPSITGGVVCNFFGADTIQVPAGEKFTVTYDVTGVKREIKVDTSPKSTTQYTKKDVGDTSTERQATITAPKKKGKLKVSLIVDAVRQNSEACKPIEVQVIDAVPQQDASTYGSDSGGRESEYQEVQQQDTGPRIETVSEIIAQNRKNAPVETAKAAPEDDDAYAYLCKTLGIGCAKDLPPESQTPSIRDLQVNGGTTNEITIDPDSEDPADLPNIGELPGQEGRQNGQQQLATDIGVDGDGKIVRSAVLDYLGDNGEYAPAVGPNADTSGVLNSSDDEGPAKTEDRVGIFTRMWRWFLNLLGFGPEYVAA